MFEEMIEKLKNEIHSTILDTLRDYISKDSKFPLLLSQRQLMEMIGCKDISTFTISFKPYLTFAEVKYGKSSTKWCRDLVIEWFKDPQNLQIQRSGKI
ncbi:hypothetical protein [Lactococcus formosensis]|uniref:Uncharacterized protein n=1 Tax=Lactococcus formosensis TaxID=1281486 RepID=A0A9X4SFQ5_9LACT|nr:hypothetical protein [Lactococcus formosensis]MDG6126725.1 hypothetical protein [Lactococcus formosensis]MDG6132970.1 hypothetical protein [Lactococcus formosensis]MDG6135075.1 hypothetical protein [Lactococcus formosensis]MDG6141142.1 hypothetical protein [Lactococcus formosensis]MDG6145992.1 hypothetical protein [Lactococcus formosensis]